MSFPSLKKLQVKINSLRLQIETNSGLEEAPTRPALQKQAELKTLVAAAERLQAVANRVTSSPNVLFNEIQNSINNLYFYNNGSEEYYAYQALKNNVKAIANCDLSKLLSLKLTQNQQEAYRVALLLSLLQDWKRHLHNKNFSIKTTINSILENYALTEEDISHLVNPDLHNEHHNEEEPLISSPSIYQTAIHNQLISVDKGEKEYEAMLAEKARQQKIFQEQQENHRQLTREHDQNIALFEAALAELRAQNAQRNNMSSFIIDMCNYGEGLIKEFRNTSGTIDYETRVKALKAAQQMVSSLKETIKLPLNSKERKNSMQNVQQHAANLSTFADQSHPKDSMKFWGCVLLLVTAAIITLSILALIAASSGTFLGATFATTMLIKSIKTGAMISVMSNPATGALLGGIFGLTLGAPLAGAGTIGLFASARSNTLKKSADEFSQLALQAASKVPAEVEKPVDLPQVNAF